MKIGGRVVGVILVLIGAVFALQGANVLTDSPVMSGQPRWLYIGLAVVVLGIGVFYWTFRPRRP